MLWVFNIKKRKSRNVALWGDVMLLIAAVGRNDPLQMKAAPVAFCPSC